MAFKRYIDVVISILVAMMIVLILNIFSFMTLKQDMDYFAKEMINCASANGKVSARYYELMTETGIAPRRTVKSIVIQCYVE
jgi:biopolymer transport protein ExbB/TolQ